MNKIFYVVIRYSIFGQLNDNPTTQHYLTVDVKKKTKEEAEDHLQKLIENNHPSDIKLLGKNIKVLPHLCYKSNLQSIGLFPYEGILQNNQNLIFEEE